MRPSPVKKKKTVLILFEVLRQSFLLKIVRSEMKYHDFRSAFFLFGKGEKKVLPCIPAKIF